MKKTIKFTMGREYINNLDYTEKDYILMEKDRKTHISDWFDLSKSIPEYIDFSQRVHNSYVVLSKVLQAKINFQFQTLLREYIISVCEMTKDRPFGDAYLDLKIYPDPIHRNRFNIFLFIIVSVDGEDKLDTVAREHITGLFGKEHYNDIVSEYSKSKGFNDFHNSFFVEEFNAQSAYDLIYEALDLDQGDTFYHNFIVDVEGLPSRYFSKINPILSSKITNKKATKILKNIDLKMPVLGPFYSIDELDTNLTHNQIQLCICNLLSFYRTAFGLTDCSKDIKSDDLIIEILENDFGCLTLFLRQCVEMFTSSNSYISPFKTVNSFATEIIEVLGIIHDFENVFEDNDFDPKLEINIDESELNSNLEGCVRFFTTDFRFENTYFLSNLHEWQKYTFLSPWYIISQDLRNDSMIVKKLANIDFLLNKDFPFLNPEFKAFDIFKE